MKKGLTGAYFFLEAGGRDHMSSNQSKASKFLISRMHYILQVRSQSLKKEKQLFKKAPLALTGVMVDRDDA